MVLEPIDRWTSEPAGSRPVQTLPDLSRPILAGTLGSGSQNVDRTPQTHPGTLPGSSWVTRMTQYELCRPVPGTN